MVYTVKELAQRWKCCDNKIYLLLESGKLRGFRIGSRGWRIPQSAVDEFEEGK